MTATAAPAAARRSRFDVTRLIRRHAWTVGVYVLLVLFALYWKTIPAKWGSFDVQSVAIDTLPFAFAAMAQAVVVISGGIDLSVGSMMSVINVLSAKYMAGDLTTGKSISLSHAVLVAAILVACAAVAGAIQGFLITITRVPDIVVTLATLFFFAGLALQIMPVPGGGAPLSFTKLAVGQTGTPWVPTGLVILLAAFAVVWLPIRWAKPGLALYAIGSNRNAAFLSGISVARTRVFAYGLGAAFAAMGGLSLTAASGIGDPNSGQYYTLNSVAAVVLGGVSLVGGVGGLIGPIAAAFVLTLAKTVLVLKGVDQNYAQVVQGTMIIIVVMLGGLVLRVRRRR